MNGETQKYQVSDKLILGIIWVLSVVLIAFSKEPAYLHPGELEYPHLHLNEIVYSINRGLLVVFVLYYLLPRYYQTRQYFRFSLFLVLSFMAFAVLEGSVLKPLFSDSIKDKHYWSFAWAHVAALDALPLLGLMFFVKLAWDYREEMQQKLIATEQEKVKSELKFLRSQINPHILFNALNNIYSLSITHSEVAPDMLLRLSELLRYTLYECGDDNVSLERELHALENYLKLQEMSLEGRGTQAFSILGSATGKFIPPFILITLVENCFKHSLDTQDKGIKIEVEIGISDQDLTLRTRNTFDEDKRADSDSVKEKGLGIANVRHRLELLCGNKFSLKENISTSVFELNLKMPLARSTAIFPRQNHD